MKKYQQLLLAIITLISFSCLLIYRHEYNKLRYVLEVLNFFGTPRVSLLNSSRCLNYGTAPASYDFNRGPTPAWQQVSSTLHLYSAYWSNLNNSSYVKAFAVGFVNSDLNNYKCYLMYDSHPQTESGIFSYGNMELANQKEQSVNQALVLYCKANIKSRIPIGVSFFIKELREKHIGFVPVVNVRSSLPPANSSGICLLPNHMPEFSKLAYEEFLTFHKVLGVTEFIIYGGTHLHYWLLPLEHEANIKITILPFNYPFQNQHKLMKIIAENDCVTRFRGLLDNVIILEWNQFLVPHYQTNVGHFINKLDLKNINKYLILTRLFCSEFKDDLPSNSSLPLIFRKFNYIDPTMEMYLPIYKPHIRSGFVNIKASQMTVHHYAPCHTMKNKRVIKVDETMLNFKDEYFKAQMKFH